MLRQQDRYPVIARVLPARTDGRPVRGDAPYWRAVLEDLWRLRLQEVTELSVAYHSAAASGPDGSGRISPGPRQQEARRLLRRTVAARRRLADAEEALGRLAAGTFGRCEQCGSAIGDGLLATAPETRYCPRCAAGPAQPAGQPPRQPPVPAGGPGAADPW
jgi:RNA polymerase-binding transcription factor DksA